MVSRIPNFELTPIFTTIRKRAFFMFALFTSKQSDWTNMKIRNCKFVKSRGEQYASLSIKLAFLKTLKLI